MGPAALDGPTRLLRDLRRLAPHDGAGPWPRGRPPGGHAHRRCPGPRHDRGREGRANPLLPVIERAHRSLQVALEELLRPAPWAIAPAPAPAADGTRPEPEHPWLRHPDETAKAYAAFRYYRDLGAQRSLVKVGQKWGDHRTLIERWSHKHAWVIRARLWDEHQDRITVRGQHRRDPDHAA